MHRLCAQDRPPTIPFPTIARSTHDSRPMKRNPKPWTKDELALLGKLPDAEIAELTAHLWHGLAEAAPGSIDQPALKFRKWRPAEDKLLGTAPDSYISDQVGRTES